VLRCLSAIPPSPGNGGGIAVTVIIHDSDKEKQLVV
jgi:hypothetical protein